MAKQSDQLAGVPKVEKKTEKTFEKTGSPLAGLFAEEDEFDRRALWRIGSWGAAAVGADAPHTIQPGVVSRDLAICRIRCPGCGHSR